MTTVLLVPSTHAGYRGIRCESITCGNFTATRVYVLMTDPADRITSVDGTFEWPLDISTQSSVPFYQHVLGNDLPPNGGLFGLFPSLECDTFVTIGKTISFQDETMLSPDWPGFRTTSISGTNLSWFVTPDAPQAAPVNGRVLIGSFGGDFVDAQFTVRGICNGEEFEFQFNGPIGPCECPTDGDVNDDLTIDVQDVLAMFACWGTLDCSGDCAGADADGDGVVAVGDLLTLFANWGTICTK